MFTVTAKGVYGLTAVAELSRTHNQGPRQIKDLAEAHQIPQHYLEQILVTLKKSGIVESFRGAQGGYALAKAPSQIKVIDVLSQLEGKLEVIPENRKDNLLQFFWDGIEAEIGKLLNVDLETLIAELDKVNSQVSYMI